MIAGLNLPEPVARCISPGVPQHLRLAVARGAIPLPPSQRLATLCALLADPEDPVRHAARDAWRALPATFFEEAVADRALPEPVLDMIAALDPDNADLTLQILVHPRVGPRTLRRFADCTDEELLSRIALNHRVLHAHPELAQQLLANPRLHPGERSRLESLWASPEDAGEPWAQPPAVPSPAETDLPEGLPAELLDDEAPQPPRQGDTSLYQLVQSLSVSEKVKLATLGSKGARRLLIRDTNKLVSTAVIRSPKIQVDEVQAIVQDRTVPEEVLRYVLQRREWMKSYPIRLSLTQNPKTPLPKALRLLDTLQDRDLRQISKSRNVPSPISTGALRILSRRGRL